MLYPVYLHLGDEKHAHGVSIPDFPGCFSAADSWEELPRVIQEAAEVYFEGEEMTIPAPTPIELLAHDPAFEDGVWMLADIDFSKLRPSSASSLLDLTGASLLAGQPREELPHVVLVASGQYGPAERDASTLSTEVALEIALPKDLLQRVDDFAKTHHMSRSAVIALAVKKLMPE